MGLFSKKEEVPEIPVAPALPELPKPEENSSKRDLPELPSFPNGSRNENINQEMVKSAVADMPSPGEDEVHVEIPEGLHVTEEQEGIPKSPPKPSVEETIPEPPKRTLEISEPRINNQKPKTREAEPIYVRIDKFQSAQKNFEDIKEKVKEIESVLSKIKGVKSKEEEELAEWTSDIEKIKSRLSEVDSGIFNQI